MRGWQLVVTILLPLVVGKILHDTSPRTRAFVARPDVSKWIKFTSAFSLILVPWVCACLVCLVCLSAPWLIERVAVNR